MCLCQGIDGENAFEIKILANLTAHLRPNSDPLISNENILKLADAGASLDFFFSECRGVVNSREAKPELRVRRAAQGFVELDQAGLI